MAVLWEHIVVLAPSFPVQMRKAAAGPAVLVLTSCDVAFAVGAGFSVAAMAGLDVTLLAVLP